MSDPLITVILLPGAEDESDRWRSGWQLGQKLDELYPGQDAEDFGICASYHGWGPLEGKSTLEFTLKMVQQGENDGADWLWLVKLGYDELWILRGWCDYTGWDCQSGGRWIKLE